MTTEELFKTIPIVTGANGRPACDHRSPQWKAYKSALAARGRVYEEQRRQKYIRDATIAAAELAIEIGQDYLNTVR